MRVFNTKFQSVHVSCPAKMDRRRGNKATTNSKFRARDEALDASNKL